MLEEEWIKKEDHELTVEIAKSRHIKKSKDHSVFKLFFLISSITLLSYSNVNQDNKHYNELNVDSLLVYKANWTCKNSTCGYENSDGIRYCGLCGQDRYE